MLPLVHNTIVRNRSNTLPSGSNTRSSNHNTTNHSTTTNDASSHTNNNSTQYVAERVTKDNSECKKLKSKVYITTNNRPFLKKRSLTFSSLFSPKSRSQSTNSIQRSLVDETLASVLRSVNINEFLNGTIAVSELNLNQPQSNQYFTDHNLCRASSTTSTLTTTEENVQTDSNLVNSFSDLELDHSNNESINDLNRQQSTNELNNQSNSQTDLNHHQQYSSTTPSFPPPSYTPFDTKRIRRPLLLRSVSAPQQFRSLGSCEFILENIQENSDSVLSEVQEEEEDQMASRRNSYLNHLFNCRLAHEKELVRIPGFNTVKELYERLSHAFNINIDQVSF